MRALSRAIEDHELPAIEKIAESRQRHAFHVLIGTLLSARTQDATTAAASERLFRRRGHAVGDRGAHHAADREADLPGQLLSEQGAPREGHLPAPARSVRREGAGDDGGTAHAAGRGEEDRQPRADPGVRQPRQHLRGHARPPDLQPPGMGVHAHARTDRAGALPSSRSDVVGRHQPLPRDVGPERLPPDQPALRRVRDQPLVSARGGQPVGTDGEESG